MYRCDSIRWARVPALLGALAAGCGETGSGPEVAFTRAELMDPETCQTCHPVQYLEWSGSMHAYASEDPVFRAMNARGQRETDGALGDFCVQCHAPMAVQEGLTRDGLNLDQLPTAVQGITCYFCHQVTEVAGTHNNPLELANDTTMRGPIADPVPTEGHGSAYSTLHDRTRLTSSAMCGACHDVRLDNGVMLERSFIEWQETLYAHDTPAEGQSCSRCHMQGRDGRAAEVPGVPMRRTATHMWAGVDVALTPWPDMERQRARVQRKLDPTIFATLCVARIPNGVEITVDLENLAAGHNWPSGAAHDRRAWLELKASLQDRTVFETGRLPADRPLVDLAVEDPNLWRMGDIAYEADGSEAHMFWDVVRTESQQLPGATAISPLDPDYRDPHVIRRFTLDNEVVDRVEMAIHIRPIGLDILDDLIATGDLDAEIRGRMPTFTLGATQILWTADRGEGCFTQ